VTSIHPKIEWRRWLLEQRRATTETTRLAEAAALRDAVSQWIKNEGFETVCAYVPVGHEPGSLELLDVLLADGCRVLLPIVVGEEPLDWADYAGPESLRPARFGLREPSGPRLGPGAIGDVDAILIPALAVDHRGVRLGRGAGHYDRSLPMAASRAVLVGVVRDTEFVAELPGEAHDVRMSAVLTPNGGIVPLPV
jgi:5-formyltetrahydrofolate cyclo-ligase